MNPETIDIDKTVPLEGNPKIQFDGILHTLKAGTQAVDTVDQMRHLLRSVPEIHNNAVYASFLKMQIGHYYYERGDVLRAIREYQNAQETRPKWVEPYWWLAYALVEASKMHQDPCKRPYLSAEPNLESALEQIDMVLQIDAKVDNWKMLNLRGYCYLQLGEYQDAINTLTLLLDIEDKDLDKWDIFNNLGRAAFYLENYPAAYGYFNQANWINHNKHESRAGHASALAQHARAIEGDKNYLPRAANEFRDKAKAEYGEAIRLAEEEKSPKVADYYCNLAHVIYDAGGKNKETAALNCYRIAIVRDKSDAKPLIRRGGFRLYMVKDCDTVPEDVRELVRKDFIEAAAILATDTGLKIALHQDVHLLSCELRQHIDLD